MRGYHVAVAAGTLLLITGCQSGIREDNAKILAELKKIDQRLEKLDDTLKKNKEAAPAAVARGSFIEHRPDSDALDKIKLSATPSRAEVKKYIVAIIEASRNQNCFSDSDPQTAMLAKVGEKNLDLLLEVARNPTGGNRFHIMYAINSMDLSPGSKTLVIKELERNPQLIQAIIRNGWENDAKGAIKKLLMSGNREYIPREAIRIVAADNDPETRAALRHYFINGNNRAQTYEVLQSIPGMKISADDVEDAWNQAIMSNEYERNNMAVIAIDYGQKSALESLLDRNPKVNFGSDMDFKFNAAVRCHVDCNGSMADIKKWYEANSDHIFFDPADKKFKVRKDAPPAVAPVAVKK